MAAVRLPVVIGENRRLVVDLPPDAPIGPAELIVRPIHEGQLSVREILEAAGAVANYDDLDEDMDAISDEELDEIGKLPPGAPPSEGLIDEERGPR